MNPESKLTDGFILLPLNFTLFYHIETMKQGLKLTIIIISLINCSTGCSQKAHIKRFQS